MFQRKIAITLLFLVFYSGVIEAKINPIFGTLLISKADSIQTNKLNQHFIDSCIHLGVYANIAPIDPLLGKSKIYIDESFPFYLMLFLCLLLGIIKMMDKQYFSHLLSSFQLFKNKNALNSDQQKRSFISNILMNIFFYLVISIYAFKMLIYYHPNAINFYSEAELIQLFIALFFGIYVFKYLFLNLTGLLFNQKLMAQGYLHNVFLINKLIAVFLLPIIILFIFGKLIWIKTLISISLVILFFLIALRYIKSWTLLANFFQKSKIQFFLYLCASEILPIAILIKFFMNRLFV